MAYATVSDVQSRMTRDLSTEEQELCSVLLDDAAVLIDSYNADASDDIKLVVSCRVVIRALGNGTDALIPIGATQGTMSAGGYSQSWTLSSGSSGEIYISKQDKRLLGVGNAIGSYSPIEELVEDE